MIEWIESKKLEFAEYNPRSIKSPALDRLKKSLKSSGGMALFERRPILVNRRDGKLIVYAGNQRLKAARELKLEKVPVIIDEISLEEEKERNIKDNLSVGDWDSELLESNFDLKQLEEWGMDLSEVKLSIDPEEEKDEVPEPPKEARSKLGQVYTLGRHRLMCGDSTKIEDVEKLMGGGKADMVFTDPPYGVNYDGGHANSKRREKLIGDQNASLYEPACVSAYVFSKDGAALYLWHAGVKGFTAAAAAAAAGYEIRSEIIWNKNLAQFGAIGAQYKQKHEPCYYCFKKGHATQWNGPNNEVTVWDCDRTSKNEFHPTQKPIELAVRAMKNSSKEGDVVLDLFGGSGSTLIACEKINRINVSMELDPRYCDVIIKRYCNLTGANEDEIYSLAMQEAA